MSISTVTITGADDTTNVGELVQLSQEFPFVEWAILVSKNQEGGTRFPSRPWIDELCKYAVAEHMNLAMHVCGTWVRQLMVGMLDWRALPHPLVDIAQRIQINTHAEEHVSTVAMMARLLELQDRIFIFQLDGVNDHLAYAAANYRPALDSRSIEVQGLYDVSHGAGVLPSAWPVSTDAFGCGFAGGLGPDNVVAEVDKLEAISGKSFWIDMERRVRTDNDKHLDIDRVRSVLEQMKDRVR
jgi:hypothetical protein